MPPSPSPSTPTPAQNKKPAQPRNHHIFDPWNSSSTGHQRAENPYSRMSEWRDTRREKLARQFRSDQSPLFPSGGLGGGGGSYMNGIEGEWKWISNQEATRNDLGVADIRRYMGVSKMQRPPPPPPPPPLSKAESQAQSEQQRQPTMNEKITIESAEPTIIPSSKDRHADSRKEGKGLFASLTFYINGSTYPTISDHKLKRLLADEGGHISLYLARKSVTHVILGATAAAGTGITGITGSGGRKTGGLLSAGKLQKEVISKTSGFGRGVKYVNVEWVIESVKAGKKLPEARFAPSSSARSSSTNARGNGLDRYNTVHPGAGVGVPVGQKSVYDMFNKSATTRSKEDVG